MDRAEAGGFGIAVAGHAALFAALSLGFSSVVTPPVTDSIEVSIVDEVGLESAAPTPSSAAPAPKLAELEGPVEDSPPPPLPLPEPEPLPEPKLRETVAAPAPKPAPRAVAKPKALQKTAQRQPAKPAAAPKAVAARKKEGTRSSGRLKGLLNGISDGSSQGKAATPPAKKAGVAVQASLGAAVRRQLKPHWKAPTGADADRLRTELSISLASDGRVSDVKILRTTGQTASNRPQVKLHQEQAVRAVRLASPFQLPAEYYDTWKWLSPIGFDKRLSQ